jgi:hypothetical protein
MRHGVLLVLSVASAGCWTLEDGARARAASELSCPEERIGVAHLEALGPGTMEVEACGRRARYTCFQRDLTRQPVCVREPLAW